jgi:hypothetical protein
MPETQRWKVHNKNRFLSRLMADLSGEAHISFEGGSSIQGLKQIDGATESETAILRRHTSWPQQTFVIGPLEPNTLKPIWKALGGSLSRDILHIQIEKDGQLAFAAYDHFHPDCLVFGPNFPARTMESLINEGLLEKFIQPPH